MAKIDLDQICENTVLLKQDFRQKHPYFEKKIKILKQKILEKNRDHRRQKVWRSTYHT